MMTGFLYISKYKDMDYEKITRQVCALAKETGSFIAAEARRFGKDEVELKDRNNFVTYVDKESEKRLIEGLSSILPGSTFIAEEETTSPEFSELTWIIDPLDGTTNYIHHLPVYSISIALMQDKETELGIVYEVNNDECFYSWKGSPAYLNGEKIAVTNSGSLSDCLLATGFPYYDYSGLESYLSLFREMMQKTRGIRRMGSAAVDLAYVACGRFDVFFEYGLHPWDVAAGAFLVKQAGGTVSNLSNGPEYLFRKEIVASNTKVHKEFMDAVMDFFG